MKHLFITLMLCVAFVSQSSAAVWYVKTTGNDANAGTSWGTAWLTIQKAINSAAANDQIANSFDNCSVTSYSPAAKVYTSANIGNNSLSITVKDWSGNGAACVSVVTVKPYNGFGSCRNRSEEPSGSSTNAFGFSIYPNPTAGDATVDVEMNEDQSVALRVFDLNGRMVLAQNLEGKGGTNQTRLEMAVMPNGVYVVEIQADNMREQKRLVVQHD